MLRPPAEAPLSLSGVDVLVEGEARGKASERLRRFGHGNPSDPSRESCRARRGRRHLFDRRPGRIDEVEDLLGETALPHPQVAVRQVVDVNRRPAVPSVADDR
jgi:hypothetical protein